MQTLTLRLTRTLFMLQGLAASLILTATASADFDWRPDLCVVGLTADQRLIGFETRDPGGAWTIGKITGLGGGDTRLLAIDFRPATGELYGLGDAGGLYTVDPCSGQATFKSRLDKLLIGASFGADFNPTVDRLRIVSDAGQNLRANVDTGAATVDKDLNVPPNLALGITGAAYTNNDADPNTATTLYVADTLLDQIAIQAPPNDGTLGATGKLGVDTGLDVGFDIYSKLKNNTTVAVHAFASLTVDGRSRFYRIRLFSGKAVKLGKFAKRNYVVDIALPLNQDEYDWFDRHDDDDDDDRDDDGDR